MATFTASKLQRVTTVFYSPVFAHTLCPCNIHVRFFIFCTHFPRTRVTYTWCPSNSFGTLRRLCDCCPNINVTSNVIVIDECNNLFSSNLTKQTNKSAKKFSLRANARDFISLPILPTVPPV